MFQTVGKIGLAVGAASPLGCEPSNELRKVRFAMADRVGADVRHLLSHLGLEGLPYHELARVRRGARAAATWALLAATDRLVMARRAERRAAAEAPRGTVVPLPLPAVRVAAGPSERRSGRATAFPLLGGAGRA